MESIKEKIKAHKEEKAAEAEEARIAKAGQKKLEIEKKKEE
jgi:hypothetical protein